MGFALEDQMVAGLLEGVRIMVGRKEGNVLMTHSTQFIYGYMASDIW